MIFCFNCFASQIDIESTCGHPFFVYGKGWASYKPDHSLDEFGLKCQPLEVGDVCISLRPRETRDKRDSRDSRNTRDTRETSLHPNGSPIARIPPQQQSSHYMKHQYYSQPQLNTNYNNSSDNVASFPQNLSRRQPPQTISTTATATAVTSRPVPPFDFQSSQYAHHFQQQQQRHQMSAAQLFNEHNMVMRQHYVQSAAAVAAAEISALHRAHSHKDRRAQAYAPSMNGGGPVPFHRALSHDSSPQKYNLPPPLHLALPPSSTADTVTDDRRNNSPDVIDATTSSSRKRRWSAPDAICNVDGCQLEQKKCTKH